MNEPSIKSTRIDREGEVSCFKEDFPGAGNNPGMEALVREDRRNTKAKGGIAALPEQEGCVEPRVHRGL